MLFPLPPTPSGSKWQICVLLREEVERQEIAQGQHHSRSCDVMRRCFSGRKPQENILAILQNIQDII